MNTKQKEIEDILEDFWVGISDNLDMNIWVSHGTIKMAIYPVIDGKTDINKPHMFMNPSDVTYTSLGE